MFLCTSICNSQFFSGFQSVLSVILNPSSGFNDKVNVDSFWSFLRSTSWIGAVAAILGTISGQITGLLADRLVGYEAFHEGLVLVVHV